MALQTWIIFTAEQSSQVVAESAATDFKIYPREIDGQFVANLGEPLFEVGKFVAPIEVLVGAEYGPVWADSWVGSLPVRAADSDVLFLPAVV